MKHLRGYTMILTAAILWGISGTLAKVLLNHAVDTLLIVQTRVTFSFLALLAILALLQPALLKVRSRDLLALTALGIIGVAGANFSYYYTIKESTVATAILLQYTAPLLVMSYAVISRDERITLHKIAAAVFSLTGCYFAVGGYGGALGRLTPLSLLTGIASSVSFAFLSITTRHLLARYSMWTVTVYSLGAASMFWLIVLPPTPHRLDSINGGLWGILAGFAFISILIPHSLFFGGLRHVVASRAVIISTFEPIVAIVSASMIVGEILGPLQIGGAILVITSIVFLELRRESPQISEVATTHTETPNVAQ